MFEVPLKVTAGQALEECRRAGLVITSERQLAGRPGGRHWHLRMPDRPGTLELNDRQGKVWVKVHPLREGTWTRAFALELANLTSN